MAVERVPVFDIVALRRYSGTDVRVTLADGTVWTGQFRTDLLTERSLSVYINGRAGDGATLYIDQIVAIEPVG